MRPWLLLALVVGCRPSDKDPTDPADSADSRPSPDSPGPEETGETGQTGETGETASPGDPLVPWAPRVVDRLMVYGLGPPTSADEAATLAAQAADAGVGTMIPSVGGYYVLWQTDQAPYHPDWQALLDSGIDALALQIEEAHARGVAVYPSVTVYDSTPLAAEHPDWITRDRDGDPHPSDALAFSIPEARAAKMQLFLDLVCEYDVDGVFLDYMRYPDPDYGFDDPLIEACVTEHGFDPRTVAEDSAEYATFAALRADSVTQFALELRDAMLACNPDLRVGGFGGPDPTADALYYGRDYPAWAREGAIDDVFLAVYDDPLAEHRAIVAENRAAVGEDVTLLSSLATYAGFLSTEDEVLAAAREQLVGGADGLWVYREDYLSSLDLWDAAGAAGEKLRWLREAEPVPVVAWTGGAPEAEGWTAEGEPMTAQDGCLVQGEAGPSLIRSPATGLLDGATPYVIAVQVEPLGDLVSTLGESSDGLALRWPTTDTTYSLAFDRDVDDLGGTGGGLVLGGADARAAPIVSYEAGAVASQRPDEVSPAWTPDGSATDPTYVWDAGEALAVRFGADADPENGGEYGGWRSPFHPRARLAVGGPDYRVEAELQPLDDLASTGYSYESANLHLAWADDQRTYVLSADQDSDDGGAGTLGRLVRAGYPMETLAADLDWSVPHTVSLDYTGATDSFALSLDDVSLSTLTAAALGGDPYTPWQSAIHFGDSTTGGKAPDYDANWYAVRLYSRTFTAIQDIDWSVSHVVAVAWHPDDGVFYLYLDGVLLDYAFAAELEDGETDAALQDRLALGNHASAGATARWCGAGVYALGVE